MRGNLAFIGGLILVVLLLAAIVGTIGHQAEVAEKGETGHAEAEAVSGENAESDGPTGESDIRKDVERAVNASNEAEQEANLEEIREAMEPGPVSADGLGKSGDETDGNASH